MRIALILLCLWGEVVLKAHTGSVLSLSFSPDGKLLASGARDDRVLVHDVKTRALVFESAVHAADVYAVAFSPDGQTLATGGADKIVRLWETATWKVARTLEGHTDIVRAVSFSPDGKTLATSSVDKTIRLWELSTGAAVRTLTGHTGQVRAVAFSPDGKRLASASTDGSVRLWNPEMVLPDGHKSSVETVVWSPDGKFLASGSNDTTTRIWRVDPVELVRKLEGHGGEVDSVGYSPDGTLLATGCKDRMVRLWSDGALLKTFTAHEDRVESLAFSPDGKMFATGSGGKDASIKLWPVEKGEKSERFDQDPGWDGRNNRLLEARQIKQDFGAAAGKVGGLITPAAEPAYYAKAVAPKTLKDRFTASGTLVVEPGPGNALIGFFNAETVNEWRTPNSIVLRINGRGEGFHVHLEYATALWRAGGDFYSVVDKGRKQMRLHPSGAKAYAWTLSYDPEGAGTVTATLDGEKLVLPLDPGHLADGAKFNRFGILNVMKSADSGGTLWLDDVEVEGAKDGFDVDPKWEALNARRTYATQNVRPRFDFGYSATRHAGGAAAGEMGGLVFRGDERYPDRLAYYGDRLKPLTLDKPLKASGKIALRRAVTDSTVLIGFFHSTESVRPSQAQSSGIPENFLGAAIEGPSREGFLFYPIYGVDKEAQGAHGAQDPKSPHIYPDGASHAWTLEYSPAGDGVMTVMLDGKGVSLRLSKEHRAMGARFDRFGIVTTHIDGNGQHLYFDDLTYTFDQGAK